MIIFILVALFYFPFPMSTNSFVGRISVAIAGRPRGCNSREANASSDLSN